MNLGTKASVRGSVLLPLGWIAVIAAGSAAAVGGCGGSESTSTSSSSSSSADASSSTGSGGAGGAMNSSSSSASGGGMVCGTATGPTRGSAIAVTPDDSRLIAVNRDAGSVTVMSIDYSDGQPKMTKVAEIVVGGEPWQVAVDSCGKSAYVVLRKDQQVVKINDLDKNPTKGAAVDVGSEPTSLALTPNNTKLYVSNWVDGTLSVIETMGMTLTKLIDLNAAIVATGALGTVTARPALAHPREIAITNNGDTNDDDETAYATEWFALRTGPESAVGTASDINWKGLVYKVKVSDNAVSTVDLPSVANTGFKDSKAQDTGCFPNQVGSITIEGGFAYVTSVCASPVGPVGVFQKGACTVTANCSAFGLGSTCVAGACTFACLADADCGFGSPAGTCTLPAGTCKPISTNVKTTTHPAVSIIDLAAGKATTTVIDQPFDAKMSTRVPHLPSGMAFFNGFGYLSAMGTDAVFRLTITNGAISDVGSGANLFINLRKDPMDTVIRLPIGIATGHPGKAFAFVNNDGDREVTALALGAQAIAGDAAKNDFRITQSAALPVAGSPEDLALRGKRFFNTGLGRWSLAGAGWGSCAACHIDGLSDGVTWYFARGPRQTVSLDGSFASKDATDQRIFNWTAIFDEVADFEGNTRGISGGVGAIVSVNNSPPTAADRINTAAEIPPQQGLQGSSADTANPMGMGAHLHSVLSDWREIEAWVKTVRSPRRPRTLIQADVDAGKVLFGAGQGNCVGCHSGAKWTISKLFYKPGDTPNAATGDMSPTSLSNVSWNVNLNSFPQALFPADPASPTFATEARMRFGAPPGAEQIQCILRPVGTIGPIVGGVPTGVSDPMINVLELRQDMVTGGQGAAGTGRGFNPPSLLGMQVGGPYFHAGNARTLEEVFNNLFVKHHQSAIANVFAPDATQVKQLVAYILSLDEDEPTLPIPAKGNQGGDICFYP